MKAPKVQSSVEVMPNYIWHLFALSDLFDRDSTPYSRMYGKTLPAADSAFLHDNRSLIAWSDSRLGMLTPLLFFMPFRSETGCREYLSPMKVMSKAMETAD